jgi:DNA repair photolyase
MGRVRKSVGQMYTWVTHMWSPSVGCPHQCTYCYVTARKELPKEVTMDKPYPQLGTGRTIFVGFECDLFAEGVSRDDIRGVLEHCAKYDNNYVFQTKNPNGVIEFLDLIPLKSLIGTTIETNRVGMISAISQAPTPWTRSYGLQKVKEYGFATFVTIEPILDFDPRLLFNMISQSKPEFVNIGADSKGHGLKEPSKEKILELVALINGAGIEIRKKMNLSRILEA